MMQWIRTNRCLNNSLSRFSLIWQERFRVEGLGLTVVGFSQIAQQDSQSAKQDSQSTHQDSQSTKQDSQSEQQDSHNVLERHLSLLLDLQGAFSGLEAEYDTDRS